MVGGDLMKQAIKQTIRVCLITFAIGVKVTEVADLLRRLSEGKE